MKNDDIWTARIKAWPVALVAGATILDGDRAIAKVTRTCMCPSNDELRRRIREQDGLESVP
jgi:hypothetical protein